MRSPVIIQKKLNYTHTLKSLLNFLYTWMICNILGRNLNVKLQLVIDSTVTKAITSCSYIRCGRYRLIIHWKEASEKK